MEFIKKNIVVILAFMLPILLIIGLAVSVYLPGVLLTTQYDFVYATCDDSHGNYPQTQSCLTDLNSLYKLENSKLVGATGRDYIPMDEMPNWKYSDYYNPRLFLHDTESNESREITLDQAKKFELSSLLTSPDGVSVDSGYNRGSDFFPFFSESSQAGYYLTKGSKHRRLNLLGGNDRYYTDNNFKFIGWIIN